ncbi:ChrR family anti-sigma-E factor [Jannaschia sp. S6380]|uniref:ChrR family anti-sigma-E factor n=1 Tax=Jannaschia sp. S6380 TaxID=2926408 RepID=UPI001FF29102|nr:ChrR family anti-sigma-E factor [Jannaschia sp. S6380]MCK0169004.1 ChrR family anti-sigma-E factor [Jannaschia sp. S6380]
MIHHPIGDEMLLNYAAGRLPAAQDLLVATAVSLDDDARARLGGFDALGGILLEDTGETEIAPDALDAVMARLDGPATSGRAASSSGAVLPQPLRDAVGGDLEAVRWRPVGMGVRQCVIDLGEDDGGVARLLSIPAGHAMPDHGHGGTEFTLVLQGAFLDGDARFARGDLEVASEADEHTPTAEAGEDCICLVVTDAPLRFSGFLPRIAQRFLKI